MAAALVQPFNSRTEIKGLPRGRTYYEIRGCADSQWIETPGGERGYNFIGSSSRDMHKAAVGLRKGGHWPCPMRKHPKRYNRYKTFIDAGCGNGRVLSFMYNLYKESTAAGSEEFSHLNFDRYIGIDIQEKLLRQGQRHCPYASFYSADLMHSTIYNQASVVYLYRPLPETPSYQKLINHIWEHMSPNGIMVQTFRSLMPQSPRAIGTQSILIAEEDLLILRKPFDYEHQ